MPASFQLLVPNLHHDETPIAQFLKIAQQHATEQHQLALADRREGWLQNDETPSRSSGSRAR